VQRPPRDFRLKRLAGIAVGMSFAALIELVVLAQSPPSGPVAAKRPGTTDDSPANVLAPAEWERVDAAVKRAHAWLMNQQQPDGSFPTLDTGQPGVTCLVTMAFLAHGHVPGEGPYGARLERAVDYVLGCQKESGLITLVGPEGPRISRAIDHEIGVAAAYNHAIASLMLSELYGMSESSRAKRIEKVITKSIQTTLEMQRWPKDRNEDQGGWRYVDDFNQQDSDLSITGWELMFLRSARNAGFDVPKSAIDAAVAYVRRTYSRQYGAFGYIADQGDYRSRCMAGAGILALAHAGFHNAPEATGSGEWILQYNFDAYNEIEPFTQDWKNDRYHYGLFNCCQGMYQLGGRYWEQFFPRVVRTLLANQQADGSWAAESHFHDAQFGNAYTTALVVMSLGAPNQLLPIYQR
jgi:Prenyltransferase and squalene oxidase repeat